MTFRSQIKSDKVPFDVSVCFYRAALEAMRNISRHSSARSASVALSEDSHSFVLEVSDSGHGFDVEKSKRGTGLGLISIEEHVMLLQGTVDVTSAPQIGTTLIARIPLARES